MQVISCSTQTNSLRYKTPVKNSSLSIRKGICTPITNVMCFNKVFQMPSPPQRGDTSIELRYVSIICHNLLNYAHNLLNGVPLSIIIVYP